MEANCGFKSKKGTFMGPVSPVKTRIYGVEGKIKKMRSQGRGPEI
jgi:hypothetical protein